MEPPMHADGHRPIPCPLAGQVAHGLALDKVTECLLINFAKPRVGIKHVACNLLNLRESAFIGGFSPNVDYELCIYL